MKKLIVAFSFISLAIINVSAQKADCKDLLVTDIRFQLDNLSLTTSGDSAHMVVIEMINTCEKCDGGPDYTELIVLHEEDTVAASVINGIPRYNKKPRNYAAYCNKLLEKFPDSDELVIYLNHYCSDIPKELKAED